MRIESDENNNLIVDLGKVKVAYIFDDHTLRVINHDGEILRKDQMDADFTIFEFKEAVNKYKKMLDV